MRIYAVTSEKDRALQARLNIKIGHVKALSWSANPDTSCGVESQEGKVRATRDLNNYSTAHIHFKNLNATVFQVDILLVYILDQQKVPTPDREIQFTSSTTAMKA